MSDLIERLGVNQPITGNLQALAQQPESAISVYGAEWAGRCAASALDEISRLTAEVERLRAALRLIAVIDQRRSPHLGPARWSGIEKCCIPCIAAIARGESGDTATAEDFDAAIKEAGNG